MKVRGAAGEGKSGSPPLYIGLAGALLQMRLYIKCQVLITVITLSIGTDRPDIAECSI